MGIDERIVILEREIENVEYKIDELEREMSNFQDELEELKELQNKMDNIKK